MGKKVESTHIWFFHFRCTHHFFHLIFSSPPFSTWSKTLPIYSHSKCAFTLPTPVLCDIHISHRSLEFFVYFQFDTRIYLIQLVYHTQSVFTFSFSHVSSLLLEYHTRRKAPLILSHSWFLQVRAFTSKFSWVEYHTLTALQLLTVKSVNFLTSFFGDW